MKIAVCMKQVPAYSEGNMDKETGVLIRKGLKSRVNVYDLSALETALRIKERVPASVTVFSMGPANAEEVIREAYSMGADQGFLVSDRAFAGADVLSTSYTLMEAISSTGKYDLILCGKQTTDGDTAQVSGALAKWMDIPHVNWVSKLIEVRKDSIEINYLMDGRSVLAKIKYPCLLSVEKDIFTTRMPSLKLKISSKKKDVPIIILNDLEDKNPDHYGLAGSATRVKKIFPPKITAKKQVAILEGKKAANYILEILTDLESNSLEEK